MSDIAIKFENISKQYRLGLVSTQTLSHDLNRWWQTSVLRKEDPYLKIGETNDRATRGSSDYVWALRNIDFEVKKGDVLGIIGKNGAGKSTLLKILSRVTTPSTGMIKAQGRIASLLEVGTGFHPELTGRENIYMNGSIMGMSKKEITAKLDEIVDFAGVARYLDTPTKRYSSGMTVRLGFSIAAHLEPEILVVDEVLAVGDAEFQQKAIGKMQDVSKSDGRTVLFVSHNMDSLRKLCTKGLVLKNGSIHYSGDIVSSINHYLEAYFDKQQTSWIKNNTKKDAPEITFTSLQLLDAALQPVCTEAFSNRDKLFLQIQFDCHEIASNITIGYWLFNDAGLALYQSEQSDADLQINRRMVLGKNTLIAGVDISILKTGKYRLVLSSSVHNVRWIVSPAQEFERILTFDVVNESVSGAKEVLIAPQIEWNLKNQ